MKHSYHKKNLILMADEIFSKDTIACFCLVVSSKYNGSPKLYQVIVWNASQIMF